MPKNILRNGLLILTMMIVVIAASFTSLPTMAQVPTPTPIVPPGTTLSSINARRQINCGVNQDLLGFGYLDPNTGEINGFDIDFCRAIAAATLGDSTLINLIIYPTTAAAEDALRKGEIDVLTRNVAWSLTDDAGGLVFAPPNFYGGESIMVRGDSSYNDWPDLDGKTICVVTGGIAEGEVLAYMQSKNMTGNLLSVASLKDGQSALDNGRCDALSANVVDLTMLRQLASDPTAYRVWQKASQYYTQEAFAPVTKAGDDQWNSIVEWTMLGLLQAENLGVTSENVASLLRVVKTADGQAPIIEADADYLKRVGPDVVRFLDSKTGVAQALGLQPDFMRVVIAEVGNYGEMYNRHFGPQGELPIDRGLNNLFTNGGLMYPPDWR